MKSIVARAIMTSLAGYVKPDLGYQEIQKEFQLIQFQIQ